MAIFIFGVNHLRAPVAFRERIAFEEATLASALQDLVACDAVKEALILSTCNRTELFAVGEPSGDRQLVDWLIRHHTIDQSTLLQYCYTHTDQEAVRHTLRVACGLDSMVLGEPQILGQVKAAYRAAVASGTSGKTLNKLMQYAFTTAKKIRTDTAIGATPVSVAYAAVRLARQVHGDLSQCRALLIGAGDTIELVAQHLHRQKIAEVVIANRTVSRAHALAEIVDGRGIGLDDIPATLAHTDIVIASAASRIPLVTRAMLEQAVKARRQQPIFVVDLAVPRNVEPSAATLDDVYVYSVDDLNHVISENLDLRRAAATQAEELVDQHAAGFMEWMQSLDGEDMIKAYRGHADTIAGEALAKAQRKLANGEDPATVLSGLTHSLTNKLIHRPLAKIREAASEGRSDLLEHAQELLIEEPKEPPP
ncbi:MAG: glutamyl-tRNA reductase [Gammaproteobacteria bacterium]|nr:glutamyl-tRNA reductase [Gammaproteobacteria bacterium]